MTPSPRPAREGALPAWAVVSPDRIAHVERVAAVVGGWATAMGVSQAERDRWMRAVWLHDALRDADAAVLRALTGDRSGPEALLHGPAAAERAGEEGETDAGVLDAVRFHSVGFPGWDMAGAVLYCADFLEPGRDFDREDRAMLARRFPLAPHEVLQEVARRRMLWLIRSGWRIPEQTWRFWNRIVEADGE